MFSVNRRTLILLVLLVVPLFYAIGTGFDFLYTLLYVILLLFAVGALWVWLNLQGLEIRVSRSGDRGQVGSYLEGRITVVNRTVVPKSWLEVTELVNGVPEPGGRGLSLDRRETRGWRIETYLARRGLFEGGHVRVTSQDPFGLFRMSKDFSDPHTYIVYPAVEPLPNLDSRFASLPSDTRLTRFYDQVTTDVASLRTWRPGDAYRRIHWPYTARMNSPMVKEFDIGQAAQFWVLLDLERSSQHYGGGSTLRQAQVSPVVRQAHQAPSNPSGDGDERPWPRAGLRSRIVADSTEELAVSLAASLSQRLLDLTLPVGMAVNGDNGRLLRPDNGSDHLSRLMETLAAAQAVENARLPEFLQSMRPHLNHFHSVTVVTANTDPEWLPALLDLKRGNVTTSIVMVDPSSFGSTRTVGQVVEAAAANLVPVYVARQDASLDDALSQPMNRELVEALDPVRAADAESGLDSTHAGEAPETTDPAAAGETATHETANAAEAGETESHQTASVREAGL